MFGRTKILFNISNAALTIQSAGLNEKMAMLITAGFPDGAWKNLMKCTKGLNRECKNLCHSITILTLHEQQLRVRVENGELDKVATANLDLMSEAIDRFWIAIEQQGMKGDKLSLDEALTKIMSVFNFLSSELLSEFTTWEDWLRAYKGEAGKANPQLQVSDNGWSLIDLMDQSPLKKAFNDGNDPRSLAREFAAQYDIRNFG